MPWCEDNNGRHHRGSPGSSGPRATQSPAPGRGGGGGGNILHSHLLARPTRHSQQAAPVESSTCNGMLSLRPSPAGLNAVADSQRALLRSKNPFPCGDPPSKTVSPPSERSACGRADSLQGIEPEKEKMVMPMKNWSASEVEVHRWPAGKKAEAEL